MKYYFYKYVNNSGGLYIKLTCLCQHGVFISSVVVYIIHVLVIIINFRQIVDVSNA